MAAFGFLIMLGCIVASLFVALGWKLAVIGVVAFLFCCFVQAAIDG